MRALAADAMQGRDNATAGSMRAQEYLISELKRIAIGADRSQPGDNSFKQPIPGGTNIVAVIPGRGALADEYVMVGAHYDHIGSDCRTSNPADHICNGATDNAAGVAILLAIGRATAAQHTGPRRSLILASWDREEDPILGSAYYVQHPLLPLAQTVAYVNYDVQGSNILPSLRNTTYAIGTETGGARLTSIVRSASKQVPLDTRLLSVVFGQGRSDHVNLIAAQVPTVFFTDANGPCYHTAQDELGVVDFTKLTSQTELGLNTVRALLTGARLPFNASAPPVTFTDAANLYQLGRVAHVDFSRFGPAQEAELNQGSQELKRIVTAGPQRFGPSDFNTVLGVASNAVTIYAHGACDGFLKPTK